VSQQLVEQINEAIGAVNRRPNGTHYRRAKGDHLAALRWGWCRARISCWHWR